MFEACGCSSTTGFRQRARHEGTDRHRPARSRTAGRGDPLPESFTIAGNDFEHGGEVAARVKAILKQLGFPSDAIRRLSIANFEAEMNVIMYADEGELELQVLPEAVRVDVADRGQGSRTSSWRCRRVTPRPRPRCGPAASARGWACPTSRATATSSSIESTVGVGTTLRYVVYANGTAGEREPWPSAPTPSSSTTRQVRRLRGLLAGLPDERDPRARAAWPR